MESMGKLPGKQGLSVGSSKKGKLRGQGSYTRISGTSGEGAHEIIYYLAERDFESPGDEINIKADSGEVDSNFRLRNGLGQTELGFGGPRGGVPCLWGN